MSHQSHASLAPVLYCHLGLLVPYPLLINAESPPQVYQSVWASDTLTFLENSPKNFVGFGHGDIPYSVLYCQFKPLFERLLISRLLFFYTYLQKISIKMLLLHYKNTAFWKRNKLRILIFNFSMSLPSQGHMILYVIAKLLLVCNGIKKWTTTP